ncbi:hypothetical protein [Paenibacillus sp. BK720]|uniref:hypothetical protein n=1 Tax=Paenibacillus sp. BK720 TaxID=2587092 RepID=UPI00141DB43E|nr:hypothetical protein [Paenibacillus sp. BK720]NIK70899.1 hypothetical protein [Paenibacillus sp. BK720]
MKIKDRREDGTFETKVIGKDPEMVISDLEAQNMEYKARLVDVELALAELFSGGGA